jgi:hypothetical protein
MTKTLDQIAHEAAGGKTLDDLRRIQAAAAQAFSNPVTTATPEQEEKEVAYWQKVFDERRATARAQQVPVMARLFKPEKSILHPGQPMGYEEARDIFKKILQERGQQIAILKNDNNFRWMFTDKDGRIIMNLIKYFINDPTSAYPLNKAPFFYGGVGTGKTEFMMMFQRFCEIGEFQKSFQLSSMSEIYYKAKTDKDYNPLESNLSFDRCFDEFITGQVKRFGDDFNIAEAIIELREKRFINYGQLTMFTANCSPEDLPKHVSPMLYDRIRHMCFSVHFEGESKRGKQKSQTP